MNKSVLKKTLAMALFVAMGAGAGATLADTPWVQWHPHSGERGLSVMGTQCYFCAPQEIPDSDGDGVKDDKDQCPNTPKGVKVDEKGCPLPLDSDGDGVTDDKDQCPGTPRGVKVDAKGCPLDADGDGVTDDKDQCPDTPKGATVNTQGCWVLKGVKFDTNQSNIKTQYHPALNQVVGVLKNNPNIQAEVGGHTDSVGSDVKNQKLSEARAASVKQYLIKSGIATTRLTSKGYGKTKPVASNDTAEGRAENRRVELGTSRK